MKISLKKIFRKARRELRRKDLARERILRLSRSIVRLSSQAILSIHQGSMNGAKKKLEGIKRFLKRLEEEIQKCPEMSHHGAIYAAYREYVEAMFLYSFVLKEDVPTPESLEVPFIPYILGLADASGELRRKALDSIREGDLRTSERCLTMMEEIYGSFISLEYGHSLIPGFKRSLDDIRKRIEVTRGDLTTVARG